MLPKHYVKKDWRHALSFAQRIQILSEFPPIPQATSATLNLERGSTSMANTVYTCLLTLPVKHLLNLSNDITLTVAAIHPSSLQIIFQPPGSCKWDVFFITWSRSQMFPGSTMNIVRPWDQSHRICLLPIYQGAIRKHLAERLKFQTSEVRLGVRIPLRPLWRSHAY